jgi:hypothetical protein
MQMMLCLKTSKDDVCFRCTEVRPLSSDIGATVFTVQARGRQLLAITAEMGNPNCESSSENDGFTSTQLAMYFNIGSRPLQPCL